MDVAIRVTNKKVMRGDGHYVIEEAISVLKYVPYAHFWDAYTYVTPQSLSYLVLGSFSMKSF